MITAEQAYDATVLSVRRYVEERIAEAIRHCRFSVTVQRKDLDRVKGFADELKAGGFSVEADSPGYVEIGWSRPAPSSVFNQ